MGQIEAAMGDNIIYELSQMKFQIPTQPEHELEAYFQDLYNQIQEKFDYFNKS